MPAEATLNLPVDIVIPIYRGLEQTRRCIESVLTSIQATTPFELVLIDDASPEPELVQYLDSLAGRTGVTLLHNPENLGFVQTVNRGMALHADRDVVLLNSDTEVAADWLDRLKYCVHSTAAIGTATPFSNNATICSYPYEGWGHGLPGTLDLATLDQIFATANAGQIVDLPTGVGFCMYIRRACLDAVGLFDAERFGRGYGEENDFCMRAAKAGWRNVLAADVFVYHVGGVSFSEERLALQLSAGQVLSALHPEYDRLVQNFIARDPVAVLRRNVDIHRASRAPEGAAQVLDEQAARLQALRAANSQGQAHPDAPLPAAWAAGAWPRHACLAAALLHPPVSVRLDFSLPVLHVLPDVMGGLDRCCRDILSVYSAVARHDRLIVGSAGYWLESDGRFYSAPLSTSELAQHIVSAGYGLLHIHALTPEIQALHQAVRAVADFPVAMTLHDFGFAQPELFSPELSAAQSQRSREVALAMLLAIPHRTAPSQAIIDAASRFVGQPLAFAKIANGVDPRQLAWGPLLPDARAAIRTWAARDIGLPCVAVIGAIGPGKGEGRLHAIGLALRQRGLQLIVLGYTSEQREPGWAPGHAYFVHGAYEPVELATLVREYRVQLAYFPNTAPESFCYALSDAWCTGIPAVGHGVGALAERLVAPVGEALPVDAAVDLIVERLYAWTQPDLQQAAHDALARETGRYAPFLSDTAPMLDAFYLKLAHKPVLDAPSVSLADHLWRVNSDTAQFRRELVFSVAQIGELAAQRDQALSAFADVTYALRLGEARINRLELEIDGLMSQAMPHRVGAAHLPSERHAIRPIAQAPAPVMPCLPCNDSVDVLIVTYHPDLALLEQCLRSVVASHGLVPRLGVLIQDNSCDPAVAVSVDALLKTVCNPLGIPICFDGSAQNVGFGGAVNRLAARSEADFLLLLNPDAVLEADALGHLLSVAQQDQPEAAAWEMRQLPYEHPKFYDPCTLETPWFSGAGVLLRRSAFAAVGGFEPRLFMYCEDVELSWRLRARNFVLRYVAQASIVHHTYNQPGQVKPLALYGGIFANLVMRMRYGNLPQVLAGFRLAYMEWQRPETLIGRRRGILRSVLRSLRHAPYFVRSRIATTGTFQPVLAGWGYEARREGAFYPGKSAAEVADLPMPLVTLIVRTGQSANMLDRMLSALAHQTYRNLEVIVVGMGETAGLEVVTRWRNRCPIRYLPLDSGVDMAQAGNAGLRVATGEWLGVLDVDTPPFADHVETLLRHAQIKGAAAVHAPPFQLVGAAAEASIPGVLLFHRNLYCVCGGFDSDGPFAGNSGFVRRFLQQDGCMRVDKSTVWVAHPA